MKLKKVLGWIAALVTLGFLLGVALPLLGERLTVSKKADFRGEFMSYLLKDENGQRHMGFLALSHAFEDMVFFEYGYQAPAGKDLSPWQQPIIGMPRKDVKETEGFIWADKGHLWADYKTFGESPITKGSRLGLTKLPDPHDQTELTQPGAPWDSKAKELSFLGKYPDYAFNYEDKNFKLDLKLHAGVPGWYQYNNGTPFPVGDFSLGSMNELTGNMTGTIVHKQTGKTFKVAGNALMEDSTGHPWSWIDWGAHDWSDFHFPGGWSGSLWKAKDDWQWGYHADPHLGWLWDVEKKKFITFPRVEIIDVEYVRDPVSKLEYPQHATWRAYGADGTFELRATNLTFKPRESRFPAGPFEVPLGMSYGNNTFEARLIRPDGSVVELSNGIGTMEHYTAVVPDYVFWGPLSLLLLVLSWGAYRVAARYEAKQSIVSPLVWSVAGLIAIALLNLAWTR